MIFGGLTDAFRQQAMEEIKGGIARERQAMLTGQLAALGALRHGDGTPVKTEESKIHKVSWTSSSFDSLRHDLDKLNETKN